MGDPYKFVPRNQHFLKQRLITPRPHPGLLPQVGEGDDAVIRPAETGLVESTLHQM